MADIAAASSSSAIRTDYLKLLVTQLQNQNPLEPMDNNQMAAQLAQLSQLEQAENQTRQLGDLSTSFAQVLSEVRRSQAADLIGKQITFFLDDGNGGYSSSGGTVDGVDLLDGDVTLKVGGYSVPLDAVVSIQN